MFIKKGFEGARMMEIAEEAGINKALLHYYFRSKEKMFDAVFQQLFSRLFPILEKILSRTDISFFEKIELFSDQYIGFLLENPFLPNFILNEINSNPGRLSSLMIKTGTRANDFIEQVNLEVKKGRIKSIDPRQLIINMLSMAIFPIVAKPIMLKIFFKDDDKEYEKFVEERRKAVSSFIIDAIKNC
ncbi:MAG: TetR/AcrR family transcriptional regulator [bacterium]